MRKTVAANVDGLSFDDAYGLCGSGELAGLYNEIAGLGDYEGAKTEIKTIDEVLKKDYIAQKIISIPVFDALSNWRGTADQRSQSEGLSIDNTLNIALHIQEAAEKARKYGLCVLLPIIKDSNGNDISLGQDIASIDSAEIDRLVVLHEQIETSDYETDISKPNFGLPNQLKIGSTEIHPSRVLFFGNLKEPIENSFFKSIVFDLAEYHESKKRKQNGVRRNSAFVYEGNFEAIRQYIIDRADATGQSIDINKITKTMARAIFNNLNESNIAVINQGDKIHNFQLNVIDDLVKNVDQSMQILSAVADIPMSRLFGKPPSGLSSSGQLDYENYSQALDGWRAREIERPLAKMDEIISQVYGIEFTRQEWVWLPTRAEEIRLRLSGQQVEPEADDG